jgi:L-alanine-DL-glutamate epimerase-like enolase superfamily enzyme
MERATRGWVVGTQYVFDLPVGPAFRQGITSPGQKKSEPANCLADEGLRSRHARFMRIGGVTGWQRAAAIAGAAGIPISTHLYPEVAGHVMRVTETAHWLEWQDWANPILQQRYEVKDGKVHVPDVQGIGLEWDEKAVPLTWWTTFNR